MLKPIKKSGGRWLYLPSSYHLYADGSASHITQDGGWAYILSSENGIVAQDSGYTCPATNNAMELQAVIEGLKYLKAPSVVKVYSDSAYVVNAMSKQWWVEWKNNNWVKKTGGVTPNAQLWEELIKLSEFHTEVEFIKVRGHDGDELNERCDKLAKQARKQVKQNWKEDG